MSQSYKDIETPFIAIDRDILHKNIQDMQAIANKAGSSIRPHAKTHKCHEIADLQIKAGATGITTSKPEEAIAFINAGIKSVKICYPLISTEKIKKLITTAKQQNAEIFFVIDSRAGFEALETSAKEENYAAKTYIEIDVGLHRCGVKPDTPFLQDLAHKIQASDSLEFMGITSHAGQSYSANNPESAKDIANQEQAIMSKTAQAIKNNNIPVNQVCIGATPTLWVQDNFEAITEIKPGNYVFNDLTQKNIGIVGWDRLALSIITTVVSTNDAYMIIDAGSKTLTSDMGAHGTSNMKGHGIAFPLNTAPNHNTGMTVAKLSEEHGFIRHNGRPLPIGTRLRIYPNHACPVVNLFNELHIFEQNECKDIWPVIARGCVH